jgi:glycosyltransferase involved in cell wall biosynthesis
MTGEASGGTRRWPLVSVILPTRGRPDLVRTALASIVGQTYPGQIEVLVVHDQEPPQAGLAGLSEPGRHVRALANSHTPGLPGSRNTGIGLASGEFLASCDDDDVWHPAKLQAQIGRLLDQPDLLVVGSGMRLMLPDGKIISLPARAERISYRLLLRNRVKELHSSTLVMRRDAFAKAGLYDEVIPNGYAEDYDWILRAARVGRIGAVLTPLADIRKDSGSWWPGDAAVTAAGLEYLLAKHPEIRGSPRGHARLLGQLAFARSLTGERGPALRCATTAVVRWPASPHAYLALAHIATGVDRKHVLRAARMVGRGLA